MSSPPKEIVEEVKNGEIATAPTKPIERRRSKIFETAEKLQNMAKGSEIAPKVVEKPKKIFIPGVNVGGFKKEFERKASLTSSAPLLKNTSSVKNITSPTNGTAKTVKTPEINGTDAKSPKNIPSPPINATENQKPELVTVPKSPEKEVTTPKITPVQNKKIVNQNQPELISNQFESIPDQSKLIQNQSEPIKIQSESTQNLSESEPIQNQRSEQLVQTQSESSQNLSQANPEEEELKRKRQNAVNIISSAISKEGARKSKSRPSVLRKTPLPFGSSGRSASGNIASLPLSPETISLKNAISEENLEGELSRTPSDSKKSVAEIVLKSSTLPLQRKTAKAEIKLNYPAPKPATMEFTTEIAHHIEAPKEFSDRAPLSMKFR